MYWKPFRNVTLDPIIAAQAKWTEIQHFKDALNVNIGYVVDGNHLFRPPEIESAVISQWQINRTEKFYALQSQFGNQAYVKSLAHWMFPAAPTPNFSLQSFGGTGGLHIVAELLKQIRNSNEILIDPGWPNHRALFSSFEVKSYSRTKKNQPYYDHEVYLEKLYAMPEGSTALIQPLAYNNDGLDRTTQQLQEIAEIIKKKSMIAVYDVAYFGFADGIEADRSKLEALLLVEHQSFLVATNSKNFGLYNERLAATYGFHFNEQNYQYMIEMLKSNIRANYSSPSYNVAQAASSVLSDSKICTSIETQIDTQRVNMNKIRVLLADSIQKKFDIDVGPIRSGKGLYCLASSKDMSQVQQQIFLKQHILLSTFRIDIAALQNSSEVERLTDVFTEACLSL